MSVRAFSWIAAMGKGFMGFLRRADMLPWLTGVSLFVAVSVGIWTIMSPEEAGFAGLALVAGLAVLGFIGFYGIATGTPEPSAQSQTQTAMPASRDTALLSRLLDHAPEAYLVSGRGGAIIYANRAYYDLTQVGNRGRNLGRPLPLEQVFAGDEELAPPLFRLARAARRGEVADEILRLKTIDGDTRIMEGHVEPLSGAAGYVVWRIAGLSVESPAGADWAARSAASLEGGEARPRLDGPAASDNNGDVRRVLSAGGPVAQLFDTAPFGVALVSNDGELQQANRAFEHMVNLAARGATDALPNLFDLVSEDDRDALRAQLESVASGAQNLPADVILAGDDGTNVQLYLSAFEDGGAVAYLIDLSEQKRLEQQFVQSQKLQAVGQLAGGVAHDFNNLLTAIIGFCDLLLARHGVGDPSFSDIDQIRQNANRAANLVRQLLAFSRQQTLTPRVLSPTDALTDLSMLLRRLLGETIELELVHGRDLGLIKVDANQLDTAIINLAVNARDAMEDGGTLIIRSSNTVQPESRDAANELVPPGDYVLIEVEDAGCGIPEENLAQIFEPFYTTKPVGEGTGLGLSTVYGIIKQMEGFVFPESEVGKGTVFRIYLPVHKGPIEDAPGSSATPAAPPQDLTGMGTILLVEDEDAVRAFARRALSTRGYTVLDAANGLEAVKIVESHDGPINLLVTDVVMPGMDGPTLANKMRELSPSTRIIFMSGYAEDVFKKTMGRPEDVAFLPKPFSLKQLAARVKDVLSS